MIEVFADFEQNSEEWRKARAGIPTASAFSKILAKGEGKTRAAYMRQLAAEIITGEPLESFTNGYLERGKAMEDEAREFYCFTRDIEPTRVGFIRNGHIGCSPDCLLGEDGILEIKTQKPDLLIETLLKDKFPSEHVAQCQGALWVTGRKWIDICVYWPGMPKLIKRAVPDQAYIANLAVEVDIFRAELDAMVRKIQALQP